MLPSLVQRERSSTFGGLPHRVDPRTPRGAAHCETGRPLQICGWFGEVDPQWCAQFEGLHLTESRRSHGICTWCHHPGQSGLQELILPIQLGEESDSRKSLSERGRRTVMTNDATVDSQCFFDGGFKHLLCPFWG